jgi:hypothetical protein
MVARFLDPTLMLSEEDALGAFGVDGFGPRCFALAPSFSRASTALGLKALVKSVSLEGLREHLGGGPVILYHRASEAADAIHHFSVALAVSDTEITRHDPALGESVVDSWAQFERLWDAARVPWWPHDGKYAVIVYTDSGTDPGRRNN